MKISYIPELYIPSKNKVKIDFNLSNYTKKPNLQKQPVLIPQNSPSKSLI